MKINKKQGFTIVELIITIAVIAVFLALSFVNFSNSQIKSRDVERKADVQAIANNLETFYDSGSKGASICPKGFVGVPGSATYGTSNFCVMKYEAKLDSSSGKAVSTASGLPWSSVSQSDAAAASAAACDGCHLITEAEWMTIAQNVARQPINWSGGSVGSGFIYSGHVNNGPSDFLSADSNDSNSNYGETSYDNTTSSSLNNKRTLVLSNGQTIWDLSGNAWEWTAGQTSGGQPGITGGGWTWREWKDMTNLGTLPINPFPSGTGIAGAASWSMQNGTGASWSNSDDTTLRGFVRSGGSNNGGYAGIFYLNFSYVPYVARAGVGFRATYSNTNKNIVTTQTGRYPSTAIVGQETKVLGDLDADSIVAPNTNSSDDALVAATNNDQTVSGVTPQPTINQYVYQPLQADSSLCSVSVQRCTKFNIYYRSEADNTVYKITSKHQ